MPSILQSNEQAECPRCHHLLASGTRWSLHRCAMIALSILILMPFSLNYPLLSLHLLGIKIDASIWDGIWKMAVGGYEYTAFMIFICAVVMPITFALLVIMLWLAKIFQIKPRSVLLFLGYIKAWVMFDVYLVALGVTIFKVREYATLEINIYLIPFILPHFLTTLLLSNLIFPPYGRNFILNALQFIQNKLLNYVLLAITPLRKIYLLRSSTKICCPCCQSPLNTSDKLKLQATWATLIAGIIMLFPANLLPISGIYLTGALSEDTLISGVISFVKSGSYFVAFVVFLPVFSCLSAKFYYALLTCLRAF